MPLRRSGYFVGVRTEYSCRGNVRERGGFSRRREGNIKRECCADNENEGESNNG